MQTSSGHLELLPLEKLLVAWEPAFSLKKRDQPVFRCLFCGPHSKPIFKELILKRKVGLNDEGVFQEQGSYVLSGEAAFHFHATHGFASDDMVWMIKIALDNVAARKKTQEKQSRKGPA